MYAPQRQCLHQRDSPFHNNMRTAPEWPKTCEKIAQPDLQINQIPISSSIWFTEGPPPGVRHLRTPPEILCWAPVDQTFGWVLHMKVASKWMPGAFKAEHCCKNMICMSLHMSVVLMLWMIGIHHTLYFHIQDNDSKYIISPMFITIFLMTDPTAVQVDTHLHREKFCVFWGFKKFK